MAAPGLFPDEAARPSRSRTFVPLAILIVLVVVALVHGIRARIRISELERELDFARQRHASLMPKLAEISRLQDELQRVLNLQEREKDLVSRLDDLRKQMDELKRAPEPEAASAPPPPSADGEDRLRRGREAFRAGRYAESQVHFFRALPAGWVHLAMASLARGDLQDALFYLVRAMEQDSEWLRRVAPRDLFGSGQVFEGLLSDLEGRVRENPLDPESKLLLAFLHYHEKGAPFAKALVTEVATAHPDHAGARRFLKTLEK